MLYLLLSYLVKVPHCFFLLKLIYRYAEIRHFIV